MAYFEPYIDADGIHVPTYGEVLEYLQAQYKVIFGDDVYLGEETPDYQLIAIFAKCIDDYTSLAIEAYNARNPQYASGDALDGLVALAGLARRSSSASKAVLTLTGEEDTDIAQGSQAVDQGGNTWTITETVTIPAAGSITANAVCDTLGAIVAPVGYINSIYTPLAGWESVTNLEAADTGRNTESDAELRKRFFDSHASTNGGTVDALVSGLRSISEVDYVSLFQNNTDTDETGSGGLPPHSFCAVVEGGDADEIAQTLFKLKSPGVGTYGTVTKTVVDEFGNDNIIKFSRPTEVPVAVTVTISAQAGYNADVDDDIIKLAIINDINSLGIGSSWIVSMAYKDIYSKYDASSVPFTITSVTASNTHGTSTSEMQCLFNEILKTNAEYISIVI